MKRIVLTLLLCPLACLAVDRAELDGLLAKAAAAQTSAYLEARTTIVTLGTNALPLLFDAATNPNADWRHRLAARICYERIARDGALQALLEHAWTSYPPYHPEPGKFTHMLGPSAEMSEHVIPKCRAAGLWYYYMEVTWKGTGEVPRFKERRDLRFESVWPFWCREAVKNEPEQVYVPLILSDVLDAATFAKRDDVDLFGIILELKSPVAIPALVRQYQAYFNRDIKGPEYFPGSHAITFRGMFSPILDFADERHADLLEAYIAEHPALAELKPRLAEVRARPAPPPVPDPPSRLGTNLVTRLVSANL